jgi:putative permease
VEKNSETGARPILREGVPRGLHVLALLTIVLWGITTAKPFLAPVCISGLLAFMMAPLVRYLTRHRVPDWVAIVLSAIILILPFIFTAVFLAKQAQSLLQDFPSIMSWLNARITEFADSSLGKRLELGENLSTSALTQKLSERAGEGVQLAINGIKTVLDMGSQVVLILLFAVLMIASRRHLRISGERILAQFETIEAAKLLEAVASLIERFLVARMLIVLFIGALAMITLKIFGLRYAFLIGAFVGIMTLVPMVGFFLDMVVTFVMALATGSSLLATVLMLVALVLINVLEGNILTPAFVGKQLNVNALSTFLGFFAGGLLWGVWGMLLSVPILGVLRIALSVAPSLAPWGELLAEREDRAFTKTLLRGPFRAE